MEYKQCRNCGQTKANHMFHREWDRPDGYAPICRACERERTGSRAHTIEMFGRPDAENTYETLIEDLRAYTLRYPRDWRARDALAVLDADPYQAYGPHDAVIIDYLYDMWERRVRNQRLSEEEWDDISHRLPVESVGGQQSRAKRNTPMTDGMVATIVH